MSSQDAAGQLSRRDFLRTGAFAGALLAAGSGAALLTGCASSGPAAGFQFLRPQDVPVLRALIPAVLVGALPAGSPEAVERTLRAIDEFIAGTSPASIKQLHQLFDLLSLPPARMLVAGVRPDWPDASQAQIEAFLQRWRASRIGMLRAGYLGIAKIITVGWYLLPESWAAIGYHPPLRVV